MAVCRPPPRPSAARPSAARLPPPARLLLLLALAIRLCGAADRGPDAVVFPLEADEDLDYGVPHDLNRSHPAPQHLVASTTLTSTASDDDDGENGGGGRATLTATSDSSSFVAVVTGQATPAQTAAIGYCMRLISATWESPSAVRVLVNFSALGSPRLLGTAQPTATVRLGSHMWPIALAKAVNGGSLQGPGNFDVAMRLNSAAAWYTGTDARPGPGDYDLVTVCLHEVSHGLFMSGSSFDVFRSADGTGYDALIARTHLSRFDAFLANADGCNVTAYADQGRTRALGTALTGNNLWFFSGTRRLARLHAPRPFAAGSSVYHLSDAEYGDGVGENDLMTPAIATMYAQHALGAVATDMLAAMRDAAGQSGARACADLADPDVDSSVVDGGVGAGPDDGSGFEPGTGTDAGAAAGGFVVQLGNQLISGWVLVGAGFGALALIIIVGMLVARAVAGERKPGGAPVRRKRVVEPSNVTFVGEGGNDGEMV